MRGGRGGVRVQLVTWFFVGNGRGCIDWNEYQGFRWLVGQLNLRWSKCWGILGQLGQFHFFIPKIFVYSFLYFLMPLDFH